MNEKEMIKQIIRFCEDVDQVISHSNLSGRSRHPLAVEARRIKKAIEKLSKKTRVT